MTSGLSVVDFMDLPGFERCVVRLLLRETELTYLQLRQAVAEMPDNLRRDTLALDTALERLLRDNWLVQSGDEQLPLYRVASIQRNSRKQGVWDDSPLESIDQQRSFQVDLGPADKMLSVKSSGTTSGGKRAVPTHIWDCLTDDSPPEERSDTSPKRQTGRLDKLNS
jgi:hypothetical protein